MLVTLRELPGMVGDLGYAAVRMAARRPAEPVAGDKALLKAMAEVMKKMADGET